MKKQILEALRTRFEGVSETILNRVAEKLAKTVTNEDQVKEAVEKVTFQQVLESYGDSRATEATQSAVRNYETKYGLKDGKQVQGGNPDDQGTEPKNKDNDPVPSWAQSLIDSNKALTERLAKMEGEKLSSSRKSQIAEVLAKLPESLRKGYERISLESQTEEEFNALLEEVKGEVEAITKDSNVKGAVFGVPAGHNAGGSGKTSTNGGKPATSEEADAVVNKLNL